MLGKDVSRRIDQITRRFDRRFLRETDLLGAVGPHYLRKVLNLRQTDVIFDVGANAGQYGRMLRQEVGYRGRIISFEPVPEVVERLRKARGDDALWSIEEEALSNRDGTATFNVMAGREFSSLRSPAEEFEGRFDQQHRIERKIEVRLERLDSFVTRQGMIERDRKWFLKLDTQGNELEVLEGSGEKLDSFFAIQTELSLKPIYKDATSMTDTVSAIADLGFELCALFPNNEGHFPHLLELDAIFVHRSLLPTLR